MKNRIKSLVDHDKITSAQFAAEIGIGASSLHHIIKGRNNPSLEVIQKIINRFPHINTHWLITGEGDKYKEVEQISLFPEEELTTDIVLGNINKEIKEQAILSNSKEDIKNESVPVKNINNSKDLEKIILLYRDGSFETYHS